MLSESFTRKEEREKERKKKREREKRGANMIFEKYYLKM